VLRATNIDLSTNLLDFTELKYIDDSVVVSESKKVKKGSLMICTASGSKSHLGKVAFIDDDYRFAFGGFMGMITPRNGLTPRYLFHLMTSGSYKDFIGELSDGANINNLKFDDLRGFPVPHPDPREQHRIVAVLDEAFAGIATAKANAEQNLQNARALFESHLQSVFTQRGEGWGRVPIEDACESIMDCVNKTAPKVDGPTPFKMIRTTNVRNGRVNLDSVNFVTEDVYRVWTRRQVPQRGDVILTREAPMGEVGMLLDDDNVFLGQRLVSYRANPVKLNSRFLLYALQSEELQSQIHALASGSTVQHMRVPDCKKLQLPLPSLTEQGKEVATLDSLLAETQRLASLYQRKLAALDELKKSLLHQAFSGQL
jgi:type I restriction enzyme S subunit